MIKKCECKVLEILMTYVWDGHVEISENIEGVSHVLFEGSGSGAQDFCVMNFNVAVRKVMFIAPYIDLKGDPALRIKLI